MQCRKCASFFRSYSCSACTHGECDCPKCQGYCECDLLPDSASEVAGELQPWADRAKGSGLFG